MSEARRQAVREVSSNGDTVASRLAEHAGTYVKVVSTFTVPVARHDSDPVRNWAYFDRATRSASQSVTKGNKANLSDAEKLDYITAQLNGGYTFPKTLDSDFDKSILVQACERVAFEVCKVQGKITGNDANDELLVSSIASKIMQMSGPKADEYTPRVDAMRVAILAERHAVQTRTPKGQERSVDTDSIEL